MKANRRILRAVPILLASAIALSCNNAFGIFQSIQGEQKQTGSNVFKEVPVSRVFRLGNYYYAVIGTLQRTLVGEDNWSKVAIGAPATTAYTLRDAQLVGDSLTGMIYALIEAGTTHPPVAVYSSTDGTNWTSITLPAQTYTDSLIDNLDALYATPNGQLFAEGHSYNPNTTDPNNSGPSTYSLYHLVGSSLDNIVNFAPAPSKSIRGVVFDGTRYWFASEDKIFNGTQPDGSDASDASGTFPGILTPTNNTIWAISYAGGSLTGSSGGFVYVTTQIGFVYRSDGTNASPTTLPLTHVLEVPTAASPTLLIGSDVVTGTAAQGYYEGAWGSLSSGGSASGYDVAGGSSNYTITVSTFPVHSFYYDGTATAGTLFICVSPGNSNIIYHGLYLSKWNSDPKTPNTWSGWSAQ